MRRSRAGWAWSDAGDVPLGEEAERYHISFAGPAFSRSSEVAEPTAVYPAAAQAPDGASGAISVEVAQIGTHGRSRPTRLNITI
jgi:hypothetical protein